MSDRIDALIEILSERPDAHAIRRLLADQLVAADRVAEGLDHLLYLKRNGQLSVSDEADAARVALEHGLDDRAIELLDPNHGTEPSLSEGGPSPVAPPDRGANDDALPQLGDGPRPPLSDDFVEAFSEVVTFADVGGLNEVKDAIRRMVIEPIARPDLHARYGRRAGGGVLLYGPPGCGKTLVARAAAGEVGLPFYNVRIEDIVDPYFGVSEQRLAAAFAAARELRPCILFIDEIDSIGFARARQLSDRGRSLAEVLLLQLDSAGPQNDGVLVLAASNEPWDIDGALLRPGRFDRTIFVPPPDRAGRQAIIERLAGRVPHDGLDSKRFAKATELFSGADIAALFDRAVEEVVSIAIRDGGEPPLGNRHLDAALVGARPTTPVWLNRARDHVEFGNVGGRWDDIETYLSNRAVARALRRSVSD